MSPYFLLCLEAYLIAYNVIDCYLDDPIAFLFVLSRLL